MTLRLCRSSWIFIALMATVSIHAEPVNYYRDIAPVFEEHCVICHRPGQVGPMSLMEYDHVRPWAKSIKAQVSSRTMPPFHATGAVGRYKNDLRLEPEEIERIVRWVDQGAQKGNRADFQRTRDWATKKWPGGEPDLIVKFPRHKLKPGENDPYVYLFAQNTTDRDVWVRGFDWNFSAKDYVHHSIGDALAKGFRRPEGDIHDPFETELKNAPFGAGNAFYLPGMGPRFFPEGTAMKLSEGAQFYGIFHYAPLEGDEEVWDEPELGFYFADGVRTAPYMKMRLNFEEISIEPGEANYTRVLRQTFEYDAYIQDINPHMHLRGKSMKLELIYPDGKKVDFDIPKFNFDWQRHYELQEPLFVPKGTVAELTAVWDNSIGNPLNPDATATVKYGPFTKNEMGSMGVAYIPVGDFPYSGTYPQKITMGKNVTLSTLDDFVQSVEKLSWEEVLELIDSLDEKKGLNVKRIWERKHGSGGKPE